MMNPTDKKSRLISVVVHQLTDELNNIAVTCAKHMDKTNTTAYRAQGIYKVLRDVFSRVPNSNILDEFNQGKGIDATLYRMFRQVLVRNGCDVDPVGHTGDPSRDEHLFFAVPKIPTVFELEAIYTGNGVKLKGSDVLQREQEKALKDINEREVKERTQAVRQVQLIEAIKGRAANPIGAVATVTKPPMRTESNPAIPSQPVAQSIPTSIDVKEYAEKTNTQDTPSAEQKVALVSSPDANSSTKENILQQTEVDPNTVNTFTVKTSEETQEKESESADTDFPRKEVRQATNLPSGLKFNGRPGKR